MTSGEEPLAAIVRLEAAHEVEAFASGKEPLDIFLKRHALTNAAAGSARTYVVCRGLRRVVGYYSLAVGAAEHADAPARVGKGLAGHPIPVMVLARLAVDREEQERGLGRALLKDALLRTAQAAEIADIRALMAHAKDREARDWYAALNFSPSPDNPYHLYLLLKDIRALINAS